MNKAASADQRFMSLALKLAAKAKGKTNPNPLVGAVLVKKGRIIGQGYHRKAGADHAEVVALKQAGRAARAATLYVTLEPCCHFGRTGPCVDKIKASGIKRVVLAMPDPNPLNNGTGRRLLRRAKIKVCSGVLQDQAKQLNQVFIKYITKGLPFVTVKVAQSLDGKIATKSGDSRWISCAQSRNYVHRLRSQVDAVLVGVNTVLRDNPLLTSRLNGYLARKQPQKIIVDSKLRLSPKLRIFSRRSPAPVIIATTRYAARKKILQLSQKAQIIIAKDKQGQVDLRYLMRILARQGICDILIEGGAEVIASALAMKLVDRMLVFVADKIIGGRDTPSAVGGEGINKISQAIKFTRTQFKAIGPDLLIEARPQSPRSRSTSTINV